MSSRTVTLTFWIILLSNIDYIWPSLKLDDFNFEKSYLSSSKIRRLSENPKMKKRDLRMPSIEEFLFDLDLYNDGQPISVYIRERPSDVLSANTTFLKFLNVSEAVPFEFNGQSQLCQGYIQKYPDNSSVNGYIKGDNFYGHVILNNTLYYVDELLDPSEEFGGDIIIQRDDPMSKRRSIKLGISLDDPKKSEKELFDQLIRRNNFQSKFRKWKNNGMLCPMVILIDHSFLTVVHNSNVEAAIFHVLFSLEEANAIFRSTDFDGDGIPDNIGFYVKKMMVMTADDPVYFVPYYQSNSLIDVAEYLNFFIRFEELQYHCMGIAFTSQRFLMGALGASFTPEIFSLFSNIGICSEYVLGLGTRNALVVTSSTTRTPLVHQFIFEVTIAHELGHSFGAQHDEGPECFGHLMSPRSFSDYSSKRRRWTFSPCSRENIFKLLAIAGGCLEPTETPFCGNSIVEEGEDCDCGLTVDCLRKDPCCVPRRTKEYPCKVNRPKGFQCHPSEGPCCLQDCTFNTGLDSFFECKNFNRHCSCQNHHHCKCGLNGMCIQDVCQGLECARLGLQECQCPTSDFVCRVCCLYDEQCINAPTATLQALSSANRTGIFKRLKKTESQASKPFESEKFCVEDTCVELPFLNSAIGQYCFYKGKLGQCSPLGCKVLSRQIFPSFEDRSESGSFAVGILEATCYVLLNSVLIGLFY